MLAFETYFQELKKIYRTQDAIEVSYRTAFQNLLNGIKPEAKITIKHEGKQEGNLGIPDFKVLKIESRIGYIETKIIGENLDKILKSEQIAKYKTLFNNIILTDYVDFIWIKDGSVLKRESLGNIDNKEVQNADKVAELFQSFFSIAPKGIDKPKKLAQSLAIRARLLKENLLVELQRQEDEKSKARLHQLYDLFKYFIFNELTITDFADSFAQNLVYGLFLARLNADTQTINLENVGSYVPDNFELIKALVDFLKELENPEYIETKWIIEEILFIFNELDLDSIQKVLSFNQKDKTDPYIYFYEEFLGEYDANLRKAKGVYYTPPAIVNFIVRAINEVLKSTFEIPDGLADKDKVTVLDFATGTGTFLIEILQQIFESLPEMDIRDRNNFIKSHILRNIYGFEYLIAPYTIAHLKLSQFLKEQKYTFAKDDRLQIYLTNTLEAATNPQGKIDQLPALKKETKLVNQVKSSPILVICGNPPYSGHSKNNGAWISKLIEDYKYVDGKSLGEKNTKWLQNDYVKFIRFAEEKINYYLKYNEKDKNKPIKTINKNGGIVAIVTSHSFLDSILHRGMRKSLMTTFDQIYILNLHGNADKKEKAPDGSKDENVFDISEGVCVSIFVKKKGLKKQIFHADYWGLREVKYEQALKDSLQTVDWKELSPNAPFYLFASQNQDVRGQYEKGIGVNEIFEVNSVGIVTGKDGFLINKSKEDLKYKLKIFKEIDTYSDEQMRRLLKIESTNWSKSSERILMPEIDEKKIIPIAYRLFDTPFIYYENQLVERARLEVMKNFLVGENLALNLTRQVKVGDTWQHIFTSNTISESSFISNKTSEIGYVFPLYCYNEIKEDVLFRTPQERYKHYRKIVYVESRTVKKIIKKLETADSDTLKENLVEEYHALLEEQRALEEMHRSQTTKRSKTEHEEKIIAYEKVPNFTENFENLIEERYPDKEPTPEQIMGYTYAILHSPTYRSKYVEFLKMDFPKIYFIEHWATFVKLAEKGLGLIEAHLRKRDFNYEIGSFEGIGTNEVSKPLWKEEKLYINQNQYFDKVAESLYNFQIGGYKVLDKYLKDRKDHVLSVEETQHFTQVIRTLQFTISQMNEIDDLVKDWV
jgi:predicted helicase